MYPLPPKLDPPFSLFFSISRPANECSQRGLLQTRAGAGSAFVSTLAAQVGCLRGACWRKDREERTHSETRSSPSNQGRPLSIPWFWTNAPNGRSVVRGQLRRAVMGGRQNDRACAAKSRLEDNDGGGGGRRIRGDRIESAGWGEEWCWVGARRRQYRTNYSVSSLGREVHNY